MSYPKVNPAPLGDIPHPFQQDETLIIAKIIKIPDLSSGSDHSKSHMAPSLGTS